MRQQTIFFILGNLAITLRQQGICTVGTVNRIRKEISQEIKKNEGGSITQQKFSNMIATP